MIDDQWNDPGEVDVVPAVGARDIGDGIDCTPDRTMRG
jgi:hypothetical protein